MTTTTRGDLVASFLAHGARRGWQISICDRGTYPYPSALVERAAEAGRHATGLADQAAQITQVWALMNSRLDERARIGHDHPRFPAAVLVIDDLDSLLNELPGRPQPSLPTAVGTGRLWRAASLARNTIPALRHRTPPCPPQWRPEPGNTRDHLDALRRRGRDVQIYLIIANPAQPSGLRTFTTFDYRSGPAPAADSKTCAVSTNRASAAAGGPTLMAAAQNKKSDNDTPVTIPWQAVGAWVTSTGITASEWLHLTDSLTFTPTITAVSMAASAAAGVMAGSSARTAAQRRALLNDLAEHMFPLQGFKKSSPKTIKVRSWLPVAEQTSDCHYRSYPAELRISYTSNVATRQLAAAARLAPSAFGGAGDDDIDIGAKGDWFKQVARLLTDCIGIRYTVTADRTNRTLIAKPAAPEPPVPPAIVRLKRFVARQFESDAKLLDYKLDSTGQVIKFVVSHTISDKLARMPARQNSIDNIMSAVLPGRWRGQWNHIKDVVTFEQRPTLPRLLWPRIYAEPQSLDEVKALYPKQRFYIGEDEDRNPIWCCPKAVPQRLITGPTGSGKTSTIHTWITQAARAHWPVYIVDRKRIEYRGFRDWPNVQIVATRIEEQIALIYHVWSLMQIRYDAVEGGVADAEEYVPILLILDEYTELLRDMESWYTKLKQKFDAKETKNWPRFLDIDEKVQSIARLGRTGRVHLIKGMQRPDVKYLDGEARDNFTGRQSLGQLGPQGAKMMWGNQQTGTAIPPGLLGRGIAKNEQGKPVEVQHFFTPDPSKNEHMSIPLAQDVLDALRPTYTSHPRIVFDTPYEPGEEIAAAHYMDYLEAPVYFATDRPDLDPLSDEYRYKPSLTAEARERATGALGPAHNKSRAHRGTGTSAAQPTSSPRKRSRKTEVVTEDWPGYGDTVPRAHQELQVGDLILVNPGNDEWGVLELESEPDPIDEHLMVLQYRGLDGEHDLLVIDPGDPVISRRLVEEDEDAGHSDQEAA